MDANIIRAPGGAPHTMKDSRTAQNNFRVRIVNRTQASQNYPIELVMPTGGVAQWSAQSTLHLELGQSMLAPMEVHFPSQQTAGLGVTQATVRVRDTSSRNNLSTGWT